MLARTGRHASTPLPLRPTPPSAPLHLPLQRAAKRELPTVCPWPTWTSWMPTVRALQVAPTMGACCTATVTRRPLPGARPCLCLP
eukprot:87537-Pelagomonas_calceolata.AAC.1